MDSNPIAIYSHVFTYCLLCPLCMLLDARRVVCSYSAHATPTPDTRPHHIARHAGPTERHTPPPERDMGDLEIQANSPSPHGRPQTDASPHTAPPASVPTGPRAAPFALRRFARRVQGHTPHFDTLGRVGVSRLSVEQFTSVQRAEVGEDPPVRLERVALLSVPLPHRRRLRVWLRQARHLLTVQNRAHAGSVVR
jgi:hypothetical protein